MEETHWLCPSNVLDASIWEIICYVLSSNFLFFTEPALLSISISPAICHIFIEQSQEPEQIKFLRGHADTVWTDEVSVSLIAFIWRQGFLGLSICLEELAFQFLKENTQNISSSAKKTSVVRLAKEALDRVFFGKLRDGNDVAIKVLSLFSNEGVQQFLNEVILRMLFNFLVGQWWHLTAIRKIYIVS